MSNSSSLSHPSVEVSKAAPCSRARTACTKAHRPSRVTKGSSLCRKSKVHIRGSSWAMPVTLCCLIPSVYLACRVHSFETAAYANPVDSILLVLRTSNRDAAIGLLQDVAQSTAKPVGLTTRVLHHPLLAVQHAPSGSADSGNQAA